MTRRTFFAVVAVLVVVWVLLFAAVMDGYGWPIPRDVPVDADLVLPHDQPGYEFYVLANFLPPEPPPERLTLTRATPVRLSGDKRLPPGYTLENAKYGWMEHYLYAVPVDRRQAYGPDTPPRKWFYEQGNALPLGPIQLKESLPFADDRGRVVRTYHVRVGPGEGRVEQVAENEGRWWVRLARGAAVVYLLVVFLFGAAWIGLWLAGQFVREMLA